MEMVSDSPPLEDCAAHQVLFKRVALLLDIHSEEVCKKSHKLVDVLGLMRLSRAALLIYGAILALKDPFFPPSYGKMGREETMSLLRISNTSTLILPQVL